MFHRVAIFAVGAILIASYAFADDVEGVYREDNSDMGISIEAGEAGKGFLVQRVFLSSAGTVRHSFEWQSGYFTRDRLPEVRFYWNTGRSDESTPESNRLIVYDLALQNNRLTGTYFFPQEPRTPPADVTFTLIEG